MADTTAPVTTSNAKPLYSGAATITLTATDDTAVAHTYYKLDGGVQVTYTAPIVVAAPAAGAAPVMHYLQFWSVDAVPNTEATKYVQFRVAAADSGAKTGLKNVSIANGSAETRMIFGHKVKAGKTLTMSEDAYANAVDKFGKPTSSSSVTVTVGSPLGL